MYTSWQLLGKFKNFPMFSRTLNLLCVGYLRIASYPRVVILNIFLITNVAPRFFNYFLIFWYTKNNKHVFSHSALTSFLVFHDVSTARRKRFRPCINAGFYVIRYLFWNFVGTVYILSGLWKLTWMQSYL